MTDAAEIDLNGLAERAQKPTADVLRHFFPFQAYPSKDPAGIVRHGVGRPIEKRPLPPEVAEVALMHDIRVAQSVLMGRVFELMARHPSFEPRLPYIYALGDIFGPQKLKDWSKFWTFLYTNDMQGLASELIVGDWDAVVGRDERTRRAIFGIIDSLRGYGVEQAQ